MVALVVVADARVLADDRGGLVDVVGVDLRRDERRRVAERARVEDRRELAQHAGVLHLLRSGRAPRARRCRAARRAPRTGRGSSGKSHWTAFSSSRSRSSSASRRSGRHAPSRRRRRRCSRPRAASRLSRVVGAEARPASVDVALSPRRSSSVDRRRRGRGRGRAPSTSADRRRRARPSTDSTTSPALHAGVGRRAVGVTVVTVGPASASTAVEPERTVLARRRSSCSSFGDRRPRRRSAPRTSCRCRRRGRARCRRPCPVRRRARRPTAAALARGVGLEQPAGRRAAGAGDDCVASTTTMPLLIHGRRFARPTARADDPHRRARVGGRSSASCAAGNGRVLSIASSTRSVVRSRPMTRARVTARRRLVTMSTVLASPTSRALVRTSPPWRTQTPEPRRVPARRRGVTRDDRESERGERRARRGRGRRRVVGAERGGRLSLDEPAVERAGDAEHADRQRSRPRRPASSGREPRARPRAGDRRGGRRGASPAASSRRVDPEPVERIAAARPARSGSSSARSSGSSSCSSSGLVVVAVAVAPSLSECNDGPAGSAPRPHGLGRRPGRGGPRASLP